ncbi:hypothetical protein ACSNOI_02800 [Actinomadura kijaniata]|uniref:hypothetical protein n=1 Tax=Actinomadura kijaniata TaxID=46161 RepID=UPI003F1A6F79
MRQIRSADPWSTFLAPGHAVAAEARRETRAAGSRPAGRAAGPDPSDPSDPSGAARRVLERLRAARGPRTVEELRQDTGLGPLEVAGAVADLRERGLVTVEREVDEVVRLTGGDRSG